MRPRRESWQEDLPQPPVAQPHRMPRSIPTVVVAGGAAHLRIRSPYRETNTLHAFAGDRVRPQRVVAFVIGALSMQVQFESYNTLGAHAITCEGVEGVRFAVW